MWTGVAVENLVIRPHSLTAIRHRQRWCCHLGWVWLPPSQRVHTQPQKVGQKWVKKAFCQQ